MKFQHKNQYGQDRYYPIDKPAKIIQSIAGRKCFELNQLKILSEIAPVFVVYTNELGEYEIEIKLNKEIEI